MYVEQFSYIKVRLILHSVSIGVKLIFHFTQCVKTVRESYPVKNCVIHYITAIVGARIPLK